MAATHPHHDTRSAILSVGQAIMGRKGYSAVGLAEILSEAGVPKGSFYHYFGSKDAFGQAMVAAYFEEYLAEMDEILSAPEAIGADRLMHYFANWRENQAAFDCQGRCLAVKLGAEVSDLSEPMRLALKSGTSGIISRLESALKAALVDGSVKFDGDARDVAALLYNLWLGASVMAKIQRTQAPFESALRSTRQMLAISEA
ncbi:TetR/AcrR family transcriptional regulator [Qipengyuania sp. GH1]|uniref:TetR/AcrR family transcriptional regulator n=1 Tax=Qipengyuania aestuarii TaxID=2867241 RepID=UPI001C86F8CD|nr:TetR/AcrR family transcriptional regulator [Qipengyuania aestuarii]MBX7534574.1 TetR/AcrR family transcriptional regulator [Qipengyuania aestuarii]